MLAEASLWDGVFIIGGTVLIWYVVAKPFIAWLNKPGSFRGFKVVPKEEEQDEPKGLVGMVDHDWWEG